MSKKAKIILKEKKIEATSGFKKIASLVDAEKFISPHIVLPAGVTFVAGDANAKCSILGIPGNFYLKTAFGLKVLESGDWIVTSEDGSRYSCNSVEFEKTHEATR